MLFSALLLLKKQMKKFSLIALVQVLQQGRLIRTRYMREPPFYFSGLSCKSLTEGCRLERNMAKALIREKVMLKNKCIRQLSIDNTPPQAQGRFSKKLKTASIT